MSHHEAHHHSKSHHHSRSPHVQEFIGHGHRPHHEAHHSKHANVLMHGHHKSHHYNGGIAGHPGHFDQGGLIADQTSGPKTIQDGFKRGGAAHHSHHSFNHACHASGHHMHHKKHRRHHAIGGAGKVRKGMMTESGRIIHQFS